MKRKYEDTFIVQLWSDIFNVLRWVSIFQIIRTIFGKPTEKETPFVKSYIFVELWVVANLLISFITIIVAKTYKISTIHYIMLGYGLMRVFEIFVYQVNVLLFDEYRVVVKEDENPKDIEKDAHQQNKKKDNSYAVRSYRRMIVLLLHNFTEIIFWFAASYAILSSEFIFNIKQATIIEIIYTSFIKLTNFGSVNLDYKTPLGMRIIWFQSIVGMFMTVIVIARFIGLLPAPNSKDKSET